MRTLSKDTLDEVFRRPEKLRAFLPQHGDLYYCSPNIFLNDRGAIFPCFALAPSRGERNGNQMMIDVPAWAYDLFQDQIGTSIITINALFCETKAIGIAEQRSLSI